MMMLMKMMSSEVKIVAIGRDVETFKSGYRNHDTTMSRVGLVGTPTFFLSRAKNYTHVSF